MCFIKYFLSACGTVFPCGRAFAIALARLDFSLFLLAHPKGQTIFELSSALPSQTLSSSLWWRQTPLRAMPHLKGLPLQFHQLSLSYLNYLLLPCLFYYTTWIELLRLPESAKWLVWLLFNVGCNVRYFLG